MSIDLDDPHWKGLADSLRKLNVEFHWKTRERLSTMVQEKPGHRPIPPPRPSRGGGISMAMKQEGEPPPLLDDHADDGKRQSEIQHIKERGLK